MTMFSQTQDIEITQQAAAKIGPNALIQTVRALAEQQELDSCITLLAQIDELALLSDDPEQMVLEARFIRLVQALAAQVEPAMAQAILFRSGIYTAEYLLAHRIPGIFQHLLKSLPPRLALRLLLSAIGKHAWTFIGSGAFRYQMRPTTAIEIQGSERHHPCVSSFFAGTLTHLFQTLVVADCQLICTTQTRENGHVFSYVVHIRNY